VIDQDNLNKVIEYINDAYAVVGLSPEISFDLSQHALEISEQFSFNKGIGAAYLHMGIALYHKNMYRKAYDYYLKALKYFDPVSEDWFIRMTKNNLGILHSRWDNEIEALKCYQESFEGLNYENNEILIKSAILSLNNIAQCYLRLGDTGLSSDYYEKAYALALTLENPYCLGLTYNNIGAFFKKIKSYSQAIRYFELSNVIFVKAELFRETIDSLNHLAEIYLIRHEVEIACENVRIALERAQKLKAHYEECSSYLILSKIHAFQNEVNDRDLYIGKALDLALRFEFTKQLNDIYNQQITFAKEDFDDSKANHYQTLLESLKSEVDQIINSI